MQSRLFLFLRLALWVGLCFSLVYFPANLFAGMRGDLWHLYGDWELQIPLIDWMIIPYMSMNLLLWIPVFYLDENELKDFARTLIQLTLISGIFFWLMPTVVAFPRMNAASWFQPVYDSLYMFDFPHNAAPSLHIAYSYCCVLFYTRTLTFGIHQVLLYFWFLMIALSVLFTHQHHLLDIISAMILVHLCLRYGQKHDTPINQMSVM